MKTLDEMITEIKMMSNKELIQQHLKNKDNSIYKDAIEEEMLIRMGE